MQRSKRIRRGRRWYTMINLDRDVVDGFKRWITNISIISKSRSADTIINREGANRSWYTESYASMIQRRHFRIDQKRDYYVERRVILDRRSIPSIESHPHSRHNFSPRFVSGIVISLLYICMIRIVLTYTRLLVTFTINHCR